jgi:hypothetical protein
MTMKRPLLSSDLLLLKWPVLLLVICVVASVLWCGGAFKFKKDSLLAVQAVQANLELMSAQVQQVADEETNIRSHIDRYRQLQTSGLIGDEERLKLVEALGRIRARHKLYAIQFDVGPQSMVSLQEGEAESAGPSFSLRSSRIQIDLSLLHEEDLSQLLLELRSVGRGLFVVEECSLNRTGSEVASEFLKLSENLHASCKILWLTLKLEDAPKEIPVEAGI